MHLECHRRRGRVWGWALSLHEAASNFLTQHQHWKFPSKAQHPRLLCKSAFSKAQHHAASPRLSMQEPSCIKASPRCQHFQAFSKAQHLVCFVLFVREILWRFVLFTSHQSIFTTTCNSQLFVLFFLSCIYIATSCKCAAPGPCKPCSMPPSLQAMQSTTLLPLQTVCVCERARER